MKKQKKSKPADKTLALLQERVEKLEALGTRQLEKRQKLLIQLLEILNHPGDKMELIRRILLLLKEFTGFESIAIRLKEKDDYPYYVTNGFPEDFVEAERFLCARDDKGNPLRDAQGNLVLECMCGNIIQGRTDPKFPFFTKNGSFWSNCTTKLLASTSEQERQARTRNRCNAEGYESVALIPLHVNGDTIGLLQFNDTRKNMFTSEMINFFERVGAGIGIAFKRTKIEEDRYRNALDNMLEGCQIIGPDWKYLYVNDSAARQGKQVKENLLGRTMMEVYPGIDQTALFTALRRCMSERTHQTLENEFTYPDGSTGWFELSIQSVPEGAFILSLDISAIKRSEEELKHLNAVLRAIRNINQLIVRERDRDRLINQACAKLIETRGYLNAWIVLFDKDKKFIAAAQAGLDQYFLPLAELFKKDQLPYCANLALKKSGPQIIPDPAKVCAGCPVSQKYPAKSGMTVRLEHQGRLYGILAVAIPSHITDLDEELDLFNEVSGDIAFALHNMEEEQTRTRAEESLKESEEKLQAVFDNARDGLVMADAQTRKFYTANKSFCRMLGYTLEEIRQLDAMHIHPAKDVPYVMEQFNRQLKGEIDIAQDIPVRKNDGSVFYADINASPITIEGQTYLLGIFRDITERKQAEQALVTSEVRYRRLFEAARDGVIILDADSGQIVDVNKFLINLLGFSHEQFLGKKIWEIGFLKDIVPNRENFQKLLRKEHIRYENLPLETASGKRIEVEFVSNLYLVDNQKVIQCNIRDITERRKIEAQLFQAQKLESVGTLAGGVAHDFNNMLGAIKGYAELSLMDTDKSSPIFDNLKHIVAVTDRAGNLTRQLTIFSKGHSAELKPLNLNETVQNMLKMLTRLIGEDVKIETKLAPDTAAIKADAGNIEQVLMNLCVNARDAIHTSATTEGSPVGMPKGGVITIKTENVTTDEKYCQLNIEAHCGNFVCLTVSDTGTGMSKEVLAHIFEPFYTTKSQGKGTGLGLSVVYGIIKKHHGWINVYSEPEGTASSEPEGTASSEPEGTAKRQRSEPGNGSVFKIYLPVSTERPPAKSDTKIISPEQLRGKDERVLVVEDDEGIRKLVANALTKMNYRVFTAASAAEARQLFAREQGRFHLILSDVVLPDLNGIDLCDELTRENKNICVLLSSGYASKGAYGDVIRERRIPFISKPYNLGVLFKAIREMLEKNAGSA